MYGISNSHRYHVLGVAPGVHCECAVSLLTFERHRAYAGPFRSVPKPLHGLRHDRSSKLWENDISEIKPYVYCMLF